MATRWCSCHSQSFWGRKICPWKQLSFEESKDDSWQSQRAEWICFHQNCVINYNVEIFMKKDTSMELWKNAAKIHTCWKKDWSEITRSGGKKSINHLILAPWLYRWINLSLEILGDLLTINQQGWSQRKECVTWHIVPCFS